jgi:hypothetical protein
MADMRTVQLPAKLCAAVEEKFSRTFSNLEELLTFILQDLAHDEARKADEAEERLVEERLKELGYL